MVGEINLAKNDVLTIKKLKKWFLDQNIKRWCLDPIINLHMYMYNKQINKYLFPTLLFQVIIDNRYSSYRTMNFVTYL